MLGRWNRRPREDKGLVQGYRALEHGGTEVFMVCVKLSFYTLYNTITAEKEGKVNDFNILESCLFKMVDVGIFAVCCCCIASVVSDSVRPHRRQPTRLPCPWDSPGKNTGVGCHFLLQCMKVKSESEVTQSCLIPSNPMDCSTPAFPVHHQLPELTQTHVHQVSDAIQPSHHLSCPSPPAFNLF